MEMVVIRVARPAEMKLFDLIEEPCEFGNPPKAGPPEAVQLRNILERHTREVGCRQLAEGSEAGLAPRHAQDAQILSMIFGGHGGESVTGDACCQCGVD